MKKYLLLTVLLMSPSSVISDPSGLLADISRTIITAEYITGNFSQIKKIPSLSKELTSHGTFIFNKENGVRWHVKEPVDSYIIIDADGYVKDDRSATRSKQTVIFMDIVNALLYGDLNRLSVHFFIKGEIDIDGWIIELSPKSSQLGRYINTISLSGKEAIHSIIINESNNVITDISFSSIKYPDYIDDIVME